MQQKWYQYEIHTHQVYFITIMNEKQKSKLNSNDSRDEVNFKTRHDHTEN